MFNFPDAPTVGQSVNGPGGIGYTWDGTKWITTQAGSVPAVAPGDVGRNLLHNALFNVQQRGAGPFTAATQYTADRWLVNASTDTVSASISTLTDAARTQIGDEAATYALQNVFTGVTNGANYIEQYVESVRRLGGKTVTLSFWALASAAGLKLGVNAFQVFGTGGSPSSAAVINGSGTAIALSTTWARYSVTMSAPSVSGKTLGTNKNDYTTFRLYCSADPGGGDAPYAGGIGKQSGTVQLWGVQLEIGSAATPLEKLDPRMDLANCQRFYQTGVIGTLAYLSAGGLYSGAFQLLPVTLRGGPTVTVGAIIGTEQNVASVSVDQASASGFRYNFVSSGAGGIQGLRNFTASADL